MWPSKIRAFAAELWRALQIFLLICLLAGPAAANAPFGMDNIASLAKQLAAEPFKPPQQVPEFLQQISYDDYRDIRFDPAQALWKQGGGNFQVEFIHPGLYYTHAVYINVYDAQGIHKVQFSPKMFSHGRNKFADKVPNNLGFAGFRIAFPLYKKDEYNHVAVFAGASYFRAVAKNQGFGLSARGLAIDTGLPSGEEFPFFREYWLERPQQQARSMKVYALLDSQSLTGAYEFVVRPGERTAVAVKAKLFERKRANEIGIAPLTSMFLFGEEKPRPLSDWRPEVHDSDGLLISSATGEWIWRPLANPGKLLISYFDLENPRGFGLLQRDRSFQNYQDLETRHELRPSAWITSDGGWGKGRIKLVEIPSPKETNDNIVAYWVPKDLPPVGQAIEFAYTVTFQSEDPLDAASGRATATRISAPEKDDSKRFFVIDFEGGKLKALPASANVKAQISVGQDGQLLQQNIYKNAATGGWRVTFQIKPPKDKPLELRAYLQHEKDVLSETWSYLLEP